MFNLNALIEKCRPGLIVRDIREIDFRSLKARGINALIFDIDDTLLPRAVNDISPDLFERIATLKQEGFRLCLTSNSRHPLRVKYIGKTLGVPAISFGFKPLPFAFRRSLEILQAEPAETAMIGDQLFMDILGANLVGLYSIFVWHKIPESFAPRIWMREAENRVLSKLGFSALP
jgi:hypothetical protein